MTRKLTWWRRPIKHHHSLSPPVLEFRNHIIMWLDVMYTLDLADDEIMEDIRRIDVKSVMNRMVGAVHQRVKNELVAKNNGSR